MFDLPQASPVTPYWVEDFLLLFLAWTGVLMWRRFRPDPHVFFGVMILPAIATALTFGQIRATEMDELGAAVVLWSCVSATLVIYMLIMRSELRRLVRVVVPTAVVRRQRRGK